jgi:hypothetical protein
MCSCKGKIDLGIETTEWGPHYWNALHYLSLKAGTSSPSRQAEEVRTWPRVLKLLAGALPCPECRAHYSDFLVTRPIKAYEIIGYEHKGLWIRDFFYDLHTDVNRRKDRLLVNLPKEELIAKYSGVSFLAEMATITKFFERASPAGQIKGTGIQEWKKQMLILNSVFY